MEFTQHDWGQRGIINTVIILTKRGTDTINSVILTKYQKYPSTTILRHEDVWDKVNKLPYGHLQNITPHAAWIITIQVSKMTLAEISHKKGVKYHHQTNITAKQITQ